MQNFSTHEVTNQTPPLENYNLYARALRCKKLLSEMGLIGRALHYRRLVRSLVQLM